MKNLSSSVASGEELTLNFTATQTPGALRKIITKTDAPDLPIYYRAHSRGVGTSIQTTNTKIEAEAQPERGRVHPNNQVKQSGVSSFSTNSTRSAAEPEAKCHSPLSPVPHTKPPATICGILGQERTQRD